MAYSSEVRLGIVLYGGVSLAIYENGVAQELFHAVHGDGIYGLIKDLTDSDILVDIVSGTSAGGVNGIFLGYALANGRNFCDMSNLWRNQGDIRQLLRQTNDPEAGSVLNSDFYQKALQDAFTNMGKYREPPAGFEEMDVFITGTDVAGEVSTVCDETGHTIDIKKHNSFFQLSWRQSRKNDFDPANAAELATLARLTSCFPVAFAPVGINVADAPNLQRWGRLRAAPAPAEKTANTVYDRVFLDGGILNNKPFSYTINAIARRTANRPAERFLFYVEPEPERFQNQGKAAAPGVLAAGLDALIAIPGYQSIGDDLTAINQYNDQVNRINLLAGAAMKGAKVMATGGAINVAVIDQDTSNDALYVAARLTQLRDRAIEGILNTHGQREYFDKLEHRAARVLIDSFQHLDAAGGAVPSLTNLDVYFRFRRLQYLTYSIYDSAQTTQDTRPYTSLWERLNHQFKLIEIVQWAMEYYVDNTDIKWKFLGSMNPATLDFAAIARDRWGKVERGLRLVLDSGAVPLPRDEDKDARETFYIKLSERVKELAKKGEATEADVPPAGNLLIDLDHLLLSSLNEWARRHPGDRVVKACQAFLSIDSRVFPIQLASGVFTRDRIRVVRLSPIDATLGYSKYLRLEQKVAGTALAAFGGFFRKQWRANDIMWGRLDALSQIVECILTKQRVHVQGNQAQWEERLVATFPFTAKTDRAGLQQLAADILTMRDCDADRFGEIVNQLVLAGQKEILSQEWKQVVKSAIDQERDDSSYRARKKQASGPVYDSHNLLWIDPYTSPDRILVEIAANTLAADFPDYTTYRPPKRDIFTDMPGPVQVELGSRALMRMEKSILASAPKLKAIPLLHKSVFGLVLPGLHGWSSFQRLRPEWRAASAAALLSVSLVVIVLTAVFFGAPGGLATKLTLLSSSAAIIAAWFWFFRAPNRMVVRTLLAALLAIVLAVLTSAVAIWSVPKLQQLYHRVIPH